MFKYNLKVYQYSDILFPAPIHMLKIIYPLLHSEFISRCVLFIFFSLGRQVCMSQLFPEEPGKVPVNSREHVAFLHMKISRKYIKGGISCRWVDLIVLNILSYSFIQRIFY